jgi:hypothetical protein
MPLKHQPSRKNLPAMTMKIPTTAVPPARTTMTIMTVIMEGARESRNGLLKSKDR